MPVDWNFAEISAFIGAVGFAVAVFRFVVGVRDALSTRLEADVDKLNTRVSTADEKFSARIEALLEQTRLMIEAVREGEQRSRTELANNLQTALNEVRRDTRALDEKVTSMRVEMVRRTDLTEAVNGLLAGLDRQEKRFEALFTRAMAGKAGT
jgi:phage terminase large subunit GpA-like protein